MNVQVTRILDTTPQRAWEVLADYGNVHQFHPLVRHAEILSASDRGLGAVRVCNFYDGTSVKETVTHWQEPRSFTVNLTEGSMPLAWAEATLAVAPSENGRASVSIAMDFTPKWGPIGWMMGIVMMKPMMKRMFTKVIAGLDHHIRTGEVVGEDGSLVLSRTKASALAQQ